MNERRLPTLGVGLAVLLLVPGCRLLHPSSFHKATNPRVCPICSATTVGQCGCFPTDVAAGYSETRWGTLASPEMPGVVVLEHGEIPAPRLFQLQREPIKVLGELIEPPSETTGDRPELEELGLPPAEPAQPPDEPEPQENAPAEARQTAGDLHSALPELHGALVDVRDPLPLPPVLVADPPDGYHE